ncbi:hypothetical protein LZC95_44455 [Pendulispora brunnea]|uniref:Uncharacterized protein n=1 Tax=Pendulispora brunnea TaxID=2905690 RepID=A0ABZ2K477_9BACT
MNALEVHRHVRAALTAADELSRHEHAEQAERASQTLAALRTTLGGIDLALGRSHRASNELVDELHTLTLKLRRLQEVHDRVHVNELLDEVSMLEKRLRERAMSRPSTPSPLPLEDRASKPAQPAAKPRASLLARLSLGLVPNRPLRELALWRVLGLCVVFVAATVTMLVTRQRQRRDGR